MASTHKVLQDLAMVLRQHRAQIIDQGDTPYGQLVLYCKKKAQSLTDSSPWQATEPWSEPILAEINQVLQSHQKAMGIVQDPSTFDYHYGIYPTGIVPHFRKGNYQQIHLSELRNPVVPSADIDL